MRANLGRRVDANESRSWNTANRKPGGGGTQIHSILSIGFCCNFDLLNASRVDGANVGQEASHQRQSGDMTEECPDLSEYGYEYVKHLETGGQTREVKIDVYPESSAAETLPVHLVIHAFFWFCFVQKRPASSPYIDS